MAEAGKSRKYKVDLADLPTHMATVFGLDDAEIMLLRAHLLVERVLVATAAARLREDDHESVPKMSFGLLIDLATTADEERKPLVWFNELRNVLAHEFHAFDGREFEKKIKNFGVSWPTTKNGRTTVMHAIVAYVMMLAFSTYLDHTANQVTLERAATLSKEAEPFLEKAVKVKDAVSMAKKTLSEIAALATSALDASPPQVSLPSV